MEYILLEQLNESKFSTMEKWISGIMGLLALLLCYNIQGSLAFEGSGKDWAGMIIAS